MNLELLNIDSTQGGMTTFGRVLPYILVLYKPEIYSSATQISSLKAL